MPITNLLAIKSKTGRICRMKYYLLIFALFPFNILASETRQGPNIIFIFVDDQGYYDLGSYGATEVETPRIDALARQGVRFTD